MTPGPWTVRRDPERPFLLLEADGATVARMEFFGEPPHDVVLIQPKVEGGVDPADAATALVTFAIRHAEGGGSARVGLLVDDRSPHAALFVERAPLWGFRFDADRLLYRAAAGDLRLAALPAPPHGAEFVARDPEMAAVFQRVLVHSVTRTDRETDAVKELATLEARLVRDGLFFPEDWVVLRIDGVPAGLVLPAFLDDKKDGGTLFYVGVVPEFRGRGLGAVLTRRGVETMLARGVTRYADSCNVENAPMRRIFERLGCSRVTTRHFFDRQLA
jgi:RimJ/RimL family protein N-acetyltransferase